MTAQPTQSVTWNDATARTVLRQLFDAAVRCADPGEAVRRHLPERPVGRCVVVGAGKAAAAMAAALDAAWPDVDVSGVVVTRYGHAGAAGHDASAPQQGGATVSACTPRRFGQCRSRSYRRHPGGWGTRCCRRYGRPQPHHRARSRTPGTG